MSNANQNQPVEEEIHANLFALQEELDNLIEQLPEYEGDYYNRAQARIAEIEQILNRAAQPHNTSNNNTTRNNPTVEAEDPSENAQPNGNKNKTGGRRRKTRKVRKHRKSRKTHHKVRRTRHKKYSKRR